MSRIFLFVLLLLSRAFDLAAQESLPLIARPAPLVDDASLYDVCFVDAEVGWAVGEHGCIWHTTDGGNHWRQQHSLVAHGLRSISFLDRQRGWAVGGATQPYLWTSQGFVLRTTDGGQSWQKQLAFVPALEGVKFFDAARGVAWGRGSSGEPSGAFATNDGGRNWHALGVGTTSVWWGGDFLDQSQAVLVGPRSNVARLVAGDLVPRAMVGMNGRSAVAVRLSNDGKGWIVGQGGLIQRTADAGAHWDSRNILPEEIAEHIEWRTVATAGRNIWIAGSPGSVVLHSSDEGKSWQGVATGNNTPINRLAFVDESNGWAVGELGTILHTSDGGKTWRSQRGSSRRAAVLMVLEDKHQLPLAAIAKLANCDGYRTVIHLLSSPGDVSPLERLTCPLRTSEAVHFLGGSAVTHAWQFEPELKEDLDQRLIAEIARQIRIWQPAVLVVPDAHGASTSIGNRLAAVVEEAVAQAADQKQFPEFEEQLALSPWQVSRIYALLPEEIRGTHRIQSEAIVGHISLADASSAANSLLQKEISPLNPSDEFRLVASFSREPTGQVDDLLAGLRIQPGSAHRRAILSQADPLAAQAQQRLMEKRRNLRNIFRASGGNPALFGQVGQMLADLDPTAAAALLYELAAHFQAAGQLELKAAALELLARRYPSDPLVDASLVWLVQYYASSETAHAYRQSTPAIAQPIAVDVPGAEFPDTDRQVLQATATNSENNTDLQRFTRAVQITQHIAHTRPLLYAEPQVRVPWAVAERTLSASSSAEKYLGSLSLRASGEAWHLCGSVERWLAEPGRPKPQIRLVDCRFTAERPHLDGTFNEQVWQQEFVQLAPSHSGFAIVRDDEYLYLAVRCEKSPAISYTSDDRPRTYDADLSTHDRVQFLVDMDRDYTTYFALAIDHRGWTNDACWQDRSWNPQWFVAAGGDEESWTIEAAIPWSALAANPPDIGDTWAIAVERFIPEHGSESLATPLAGETDPTSYGLLRFK